MKQSRFPLISILELREQAKKRAEDALAVAIQMRHAAEQQCLSARAELSSLADGLGGSHFTADAQQRGWRALAHQEQICRDLEVRLREVESNVNREREVLIGASRDHELVLKLQGKWRQAKEREEMKVADVALDDFVNARIATRQNAELQR